MLCSFAIKCTHGLWNWFFQMTDFPDSHFWSKRWWWVVGRRKQKGRKLIRNDCSVPDCMLTHLPVMSFSHHVKLQERNASLMCFTWGNKALRSDWLSFTAGKDWVQTFDSFTPKLRGDHCMFSCLLGLYKHTFVMSTYHWLCEHSHPLPQPTDPPKTQLSFFPLWFAPVVLL